MTIRSAVIVRPSARADIVPVTQARVDRRVVDRIKAGVGTVERHKERQHVNVGKRPQRSVENPLQPQQVSAESIGIGE